MKGERKKKNTLALSPAKNTDFLGQSCQTDLTMRLKQEDTHGHRICLLWVLSRPFHRNSVLRRRRDLFNNLTIKNCDKV